MTTPAFIVAASDHQLDDIAAMIADEQARRRTEALASTMRPDGWDVLEAAALAHGCTVAMLRGPRRQAWLVEARRAVIAKLRAQGWSYPRIAHLLDRDHTTIIHNVRAMEASQ